MPPEDQTTTAVRPVNNEPYRGRYWQDSNGSWHIWTGPNGYRPFSLATYAPEAAGPIQEQLDRLGRFQQATELGEEFLRLNSVRGTGGIQHIIRNNPWRTFNDFPTQRMDQIAQNRVWDFINAAGIGARQTDTPTEQVRIERTGPTIDQIGPANRASILAVNVERDVQLERIDRMRDWAMRNRNLDEFDEWWTRNVRGIRARHRRRWEATNGPIENQSYYWGRQRPNPNVGAAVGRMAGQSAARATEQVGQRRRRYNPETGRIE